MASTVAPIGDLVRSWREQRHLSQLDLAADAQISQKHLSFIESGRSAPSRDMVMLLAEQLEVPLRDRNTMLLAAGYAPLFRQRPLDDPALARARATLDRILAAHEPYPALTVDHHWTMIAANGAVGPLLTGVAAHLLVPPVNVLRLSLHPEGLAPRIVNLAEWRGHLLERLKRQHRHTRDVVIGTLLAELSGYPYATAKTNARGGQSHVDDIAVPLRLKTPQGVLSFLSTVTVFGTALDVTLSELSLEAFYPADEETMAALRGGL